MFYLPLFPLDTYSYDGLREWQVLSYKAVRTSNIIKSLLKNSEGFS